MSTPEPEYSALDQPSELHHQPTSPEPIISHNIPPTYDNTTIATDILDDMFDIDQAIYSRVRGNAIARTTLTSPPTPHPPPPNGISINSPQSTSTTSSNHSNHLSVDVTSRNSISTTQSAYYLTPLQSPACLQQPQYTPHSTTPSCNPVSPSNKPIVTKPFDLNSLRISENHFGPTTKPPPNSSQYTSARRPTSLAPSRPAPTLGSHQSDSPAIASSKPISPQTPSHYTAVSSSATSIPSQIITPSTPMNRYQQQHKQTLEQLKRHSLTGASLFESVKKMVSPAKQALKKTHTVSVPYIPTLFDPEPQLNNPTLSTSTPSSPSIPLTQTSTIPSTTSIPAINSYDLYNINQLHSQHYINGLKLWTVSLNMGAHDIEGSSGGKYRKEVQQSLPQLFPPGMDLYVLAVQEGKGEAISDIVNAYLSEHYDVFKLNAFPMVEGRGDGSFISTKYTGIVCYARRNLLPFISIIGSIPYSLGITQGSKGGGCLALMIFGLTFLFIGVHLPANSLSGRLDSITNILSGCLAKMFPSLAGFEATTCINNVLFMGDTNFKMQISDIDALNCIYDQGILNKQHGWFKPLGDAGTLLAQFPSFLCASSNTTPTTTPIITTNNISHPLISSDSTSLLPSSPPLLTSSSSLGSTTSITTALKQYDRSYGLAWMYGMDELKAAHQQYGLLSTFSEPYPSPLLFPTYKRIEGTILSSPHVADEIKSIFRTRFKEAFYKGGQVVVRVPAFTDRIVYHSLSNCMHPLRYSTTSLQNVDNLLFSGYQYQRSILPHSDITNQLIFLNHQLGNQEKLHRSYAISKKLINQPNYISSLSFHHSTLIPQRDQYISQHAYYTSSLHHLPSQPLSQPLSQPQPPSQQNHLSSSSPPPPPPQNMAPSPPRLPKRPPLPPTDSILSKTSTTLPLQTPTDDDTFPQHNPRVSHLPQTCDIYSCIETLTFSDHRPVVAGFHIAIPQLSMPTILSYIDNWITTQQQSCTPPPPPPPSNETTPTTTPPNSPVACSTALVTSPSNIQQFNATQQIFFPPIPTLRPFSRQSLMWLEPPLQILTKAIHRGIFSFRVMISSLSLLIPYSTSISNTTQLAQSSLLSRNNNHNLLHRFNLAQEPGENDPLYQQSTSTPSPPLPYHSQLQSNPLLLQPQQPISSHVLPPTGPKQSINYFTAQQRLFKTHTSSSHQLFASNPIESNTARFSTSEFSPYPSHGGAKSGTYHAQKNLATQPSGCFDTFTPGQQQQQQQLPHYHPRNKGDLLNISKLDLSKASKDGIDPQGPAYSTQSKISKGSRYRPLNYVPPHPGSPLDPNDFSDIPAQHTPLLRKSMENSTHPLNFHDIQQVPTLTEYSYSQHSINYAKMLFPAPLEHVSLVPRIQTLHKHLGESVITQSTLSPSTSSNSFSNLHQIPSPMQSSPGSNNVNYQYITLPHGVDNNLALSTTQFNQSTNTVNLPVLSLEYSSHPQEFDTPKLCTGQSTILQPYSQQQRQTYHNLYGNVISLPVKNFKAKSGQTAINASFETTNPYAYCSLHCCFSLDLQRQRIEEEELMKQAAQCENHSEHPQFDSSRSNRANSSIRHTLSNHGADTHQSDDSIVEAHPFVDLPDIIQSTLQLSLFDFLYSSQFITTGLNHTSTQTQSNQAQQPISVDIPVYSGGSLLTAPNGLPYKLRLNVNPYYSVREDIL